MSANLGGYLDVKVPSGSRKRGFTTPWKVSPSAAALRRRRRRRTNAFLPRRPGDGSGARRGLRETATTSAWRCWWAVEARSLASRSSLTRRSAGRNPGQSRGQLSPSPPRPRRGLISDVSFCRSRRFAFGVFQQLPRRPSLFLAGSSETESQCWMGHIRGLLHNRLLNQGNHSLTSDPALPYPQHRLATTTSSSVSGPHTRIGK